MRTKRRHHKKKKCNCNNIPFFSKWLSRKNKKKGGTLENKTFVGNSWGPNPDQWPEQHNGNWYTLNKYEAPIRGGKRKLTKKKKGGSLFVLDDLQTLFNGVKYNLNFVNSTLTTSPIPVNPSPYMDQYVPQN